MAKEIKIKPLGLRVVVKPQEPEEITVGGLILPPSAQDDAKPEVGKIITLGTGEDDKTFNVKEGDTVFFKKYSPDEIEIGGEIFYVLHNDDLLAVVEG